MVPPGEQFLSVTYIKIYTGYSNIHTAFLWEGQAKVLNNRTKFLTAPGEEPATIKQTEAHNKY